MIAVIGAGAFGAALAVVQARAGRGVALWGRGSSGLDTARETPRLSGAALPSGVGFTSDLRNLAGAEATLLALPAQATGPFLGEHAGRLPDAPLVLCAKGLDAKTLLFQSQIAAVANRPLAALTGPGFAGEIARGLPTALTLACPDAALGRRLQTLLSTPVLRLYFTEDIVGAQLGGALKNVVAIACGMADGAGLGHSARAALMTRGFAEMLRLAAKLDARPETLAGLSGLGDLSLTCNSPQSRNFALGRALGAGEPRPGGTVEGVATARAACQLGAARGVDTPIADAVADVLDGVTTLESAMEALLSRPLKEE